MKRLPLLLALACAASAHANVKLPALFSDHMVMQADTAVPVWGWAAPGEDVTVSIAAQSKITKAGADGKWSLKLDNLKAEAKPQTLTVKGANTLTVEDVLIGEVWLGGGQSNMAFKVAAPNVAPQTLEEAKAQAASVRPLIRFFMTGGRGADEPQEDVEGRWAIAAPETISTCSAVAWYFGLALHQKLHTPVGLIVSSVGGTAAEVWIPKKELDTTSVAAAIWKRHNEALAGYSKEKEAKYTSEEMAWRKANPTKELQVKNARSRPKELYSPEGHKAPVRLYNGKIAGLEPYAVKGIIWFQADGNNSHPEEYSELIQTLIKTWRAHWHSELPFYYVEMNNMHALQTKVDDDRPLAQIREAQNGALKLPKTGVVAAIDLGVAENAHFPVKKPVGDRLANLALSEVYHFPLGEVHSPEFADFKVEGDRIRVSFKYAEGLRARGDKVRGFVLQNADGQWSWAEGKIDGSDLLLWSAEAPSPQGLRYGWAENPIISIENGAGLPLRPFRIDLSQAKKSAAKAKLPKPAAPPPGALPPLVVSTDPAYDQYVSRLYVMSTVLPNGRICYVAYGSKGVPPGTDGAAPPNYLTFYYSDDKGKTLHIGFFLVPPPEPEPPGAMVDPRIGQTPDGDAIVFFPTVRGGRSKIGWYSLYGCVVRNSQKGTRGTFAVGPSCYLCRGTAGQTTIVDNEVLMPSFVSLKAGAGITHDYDGLRLWRLAIHKGDVIVPELLSQLPDLPNLEHNSGFCDPFIASLGGNDLRMLIRAMPGPYWCDSHDKGRTWGVPYQPKGIPAVKNVIDGMMTDHEGELVVAYNGSPRGRMQAELAVYRKDGEIAKLLFDARQPPTGTHMANFVVSIDRDKEGRPTGNYIVTYDHGRNTKAAGLEADGVNYKGAICTAIVPKASVLAGTLDGVVIHDVPTHPQSK